MKILCVADQPSRALWDFFDPVYLEDIDLILSAGDLPPAYLSFLVTFAHCPVLYVHGNHDVRYAKTPPEGCTCVEDKIYTYGQLRILGLGGSMRYREGDHQYTEKEMERRIRRLKWQLWRNKGFDILLTHAPARGAGDLDDLPHRGFDCFNRLIERYEPAAMVYGHVHMSYGYRMQRELQQGSTRLINAYERYVFTISPSSSQRR